MNQKLTEKEIIQGDDAQRLLVAVLNSWERNGMPASVAIFALTMAAISAARGTGLPKEEFIGQAISLWDALDKGGAP